GTLSLSDAGLGSVSSYHSTVSLSDDHGGMDTRSFWWLVSNPAFSWAWTSPPAPTISPISDQASSEGDTISLQVSATAGIYSLDFGAIGLPDGLSIDPSTGLMSGTIAASAAQLDAYPVTLLVDDWVSDEVSLTFNLSVGVSNHAPLLDSIPSLSSAAGDSIDL